MTWVMPPEPEGLELNVSFSFIKIQTTEEAQPIPAMTFTQILTLLQSLRSQVTTETPAVKVLERCIDVFTQQNH